MQENLHYVMHFCIKVKRTIKVIALNDRLFAQLYESYDEFNNNLLIHTKVCWFSSFHQKLNKKNLMNWRRIWKMKSNFKQAAIPLGLYCKSKFGISIIYSEKQKKKSIRSIVQKTFSHNQHPWKRSQDGYKLLELKTRFPLKIIKIDRFSTDHRRGEGN